MSPRQACTLDPQLTQNEGLGSCGVALAPIGASMSEPTSTYRQFSVARDELGTIRIVNDATKHIMAALSRREAKQLSRELRRVVKAASKS
jgi:hypothetical protein